MWVRSQDKENLFKVDTFHIREYRVKSEEKIKDDVAKKYGIKGSWNEYGCYYFLSKEPLEEQKK